MAAVRIGSFRPSMVLTVARPATTVQLSPQIREPSINSTQTVTGRSVGLAAVHGRDFPQPGDVQSLRPAVGLEDDGLERTAR